MEDVRLHESLLVRQSYSTGKLCDLHRGNHATGEKKSGARIDHATERKRKRLRYVLSVDSDCQEWILVYLSQWIMLKRFFSAACSFRCRIVLALICLISLHFYIRGSYLTRGINALHQRIDHSRPLILLYTYNHSIKTRENICQGRRNGGHVVNFDHCPFKCEFSCRIEDFQRRSPLAVLFFGEDFYRSFKLTDRNRTSFE